MGREWKTEWIKVRYRHLGLLLTAFLGLIFLWSTWGLGKSDPSEIQDGYRMLFLQMPLINTVLLPTMIAMLSSRLCDAEIKGDTLKLLCTLEKKGRLFDIKYAMGAWYLALFVGAQVGMVFLIGKLYGFVRPLEPIHLVFLVVEIYLPSLVILLLQQILSLFCENQIFPLGVGIFGSFVGLFSWFFPGNPLRVLFLWAYYALLGFINYTWDEETRIMSFYNVSMSVPAVIILMVVLVGGYRLCRYMFLRKEI
ncbi:MAG: ABC transporter permease [Clostridiales bacterium]|nr:ABC transporter permease [Clostridiales bacterium]